MQAAIRLLIRLLAAALPLIAILAVPTSMRMVALVAFLAAIIAMTTNHRFNLAGHVRMAAAEGVGLDAVQERIGQAISATQQRAQKVVVVAHSQGGYLAHRVLAEQQHTDITLITVGSGLRPITALRVMGSRPRYVIGCWVALLGTLGVELWLLTHFDTGQIFSPFTQMGVDPGLLLAALVVGVMPPELWSSATPAGIFDTVLTSLPSIEFDKWIWAAGAAYLLLFVTLRQLGPGFMAALRISPLRRTSWLDITTHHDLVGRLTAPALPLGVEEKAVVVSGNAIADHVRYFNKPGLTAWLVAERISSALGNQADSTLDQARENALARSTRRHDLRAAALVVVLLFVGTLAVVNEGDPFGAMLAAIPPVMLGLFLPLSVIVWVGDTRDSRQVAETLVRQNAPRPAPLLLESRRAEAAVLVALAMTAALSAVATHGWLRELGLMRQGVELVTALMLWVVACLSLAAAVAAGYRPPPVKVTGLLLGITLLLAVPAWLSMAPHYPQHFAPLALPTFAALPLMALGALIGFKPLKAGMTRVVKRAAFALARK